MMNRRSLLFTLALGTVLTLAPSALADEWISTGVAVRTKSIGFISVNVYQIEHQVKVKKPTRSRQAVIEHGETDKRFILTFLRDVPQKKIREAFAEALNKNGGSAAVGAVSGVFKDDGPDFAKGSQITVTFAAANKSTTIVTPGGRTALNGDDHMKSVWKIWFGNIDQASIPEGLVSRL